MVNTGPLKQYLEAVDAYKAGDKEKSLVLLAESLGTDSPTAIMKDALAELTQANQAVLTIILQRSKGTPDG